MKVILAYDVSSGHSEVKEGLLDKGFFDYWAANYKKYYLPASTLWHPELRSEGTAVNLFNDLVKSLNLDRPKNEQIIIKRAIAFENTTWTGVQGEPHTV